jgi:hypothetical protein
MGDNFHMFQDQLYTDYLRQLTQSRELMLNELMIKRTAGDGAGALSVLDSLCRRMVGVPLSLIRRTSPERLMDLIRLSGQANFNSILVAELLLQDVELSEEVGNNSQAMVSRLQAFYLLVESLNLLAPDEQVEYRKKLDALASKMESTCNDPYLKSKIDDYRAQKKY